MTDELLNAWYQQLLDELEEIKAERLSPLQRVTASMQLIKAAISRIREALMDFTFNEQLTEVRLNKYWMVRFYALFIYQTEHFRIVDALPKGSAKAKLKHYQQRQKALTAHLKDYSIWFGYYKNELEVFDGALFKGRGADVLFLPESPDFFGHELPHCTYIFARFMAYERLIDELELKINPVSVGQGKTYTHGLVWTGNKVNVAELAYGLYYAGQFNHGNAEVTDIYKWLEESLGISMGSVHRKFIDLRRRNTASPTKLLDKMREAIHQRIDEDLRYKPNRGIKLSKPVKED